MPERPTLLAGLAVALVAVSPPVDGRADASLPWHMAQHLVLLGVAAPLLAVTWLRTWRSATTVPLGPAVGLVLLHVAVVTAWHLPALFDAAERSLPVHVVEHLSFVGSAVGLWWAAGLGRRAAPPVVALAVFVASLPGIALGAAMTLATSPWYASYPSVADQQVAGALMWGVGGTATVVCGVLSLARSLGALEPA